MVLADLTWQLDNGPILNSDVSLPFTDIETVQGFDSAPFRETQRDHEGVDGGFMDAEFETGRDIVLSGTVYATDVNNIESYLDSLKQNFAPRTSPVPLVFKAAGVNERVIYVKPRGCRYNWDQGYRTGTVPIQLMLYAEDPRFYDNVLQGFSVPLGGQATTGMGFRPITDTFTRSVSNGWGTADTGQSWTVVGTAADFSVTGTKGQHSLAALSAPHFSQIGSFADGDVAFDVTIPVNATGGNYDTGDAIFRYVDSNNYYQCHLIADTDGFAKVGIGKLVAGVFTTLAGLVSVGAYSPGTVVKMRAEVFGSTLKVKGWLSTASEPDSWTGTATDTSFTAAGQLSIKTQLSGGNTNTQPVVIQVDNYLGNTGMGFPLGFGPTVSPTGATVVNGGNRPTPATFTIQGPVTNPSILNAVTGQILSFNITLGASDVLVVDSGARTVILNGNANVRNTLQQPNWWLFPPGSTNVVFNGVGSGTLIINLRNAWR